MTSWSPDIAAHRGPRYRAIAEALAQDVRHGRLPPGTRLPTHRDLAWRLRVTVGTVSRAYAEAERRGLITGEVGRGTYVRSLGDGMPPGPAAEPKEGEFFELSINRPRAPSERAAMSAALAALAAAPDIEALLDYQPHAGRAADRAAGAVWLGHSGLQTSAERVVVTASGQHAMASALAAVARPGDTIAVEALTYPGIRAVASLLHLRLVPVAIDEHGLVPEAFAAACRAGPIRALYTMPTLHNPTTATLPLERREAVAAIARQYGVALVEDDIYGFLLSEPLPPFAALAPELGFHLTSASKSMMPGLRIGFVHAPQAQVERVAAAVRGTVYSAPPLMARIVTRWIEDGTALGLVREKRAETARRQAALRRKLGQFEIRTDPAAAHAWLTLPEGWRAEDFAAAARRRGVGITPATAFTVGRPIGNAVRLCLATTATIEELERGLEILAALLEEPPEAYLSVV